MLVLGAGGYVNPFCQDLQQVLSSSSKIILLSNNTQNTPEEQESLLDDCSNVIFYASESSFEDSATVDLLRLCGEKRIVVVTETDSRQGKMTDEDIRDRAAEFLRGRRDKAVLHHIFGSEDVGWTPLIPYFTDLAFRRMSLRKIRRRLQK